jgi:quinohemoprotein amine dehydrogenase alpha subunit-like protein
MRCLALVLLLATATSLDAAPPPQLPLLGTRLRSLPAGTGKTQTEAACIACHSTDMLMQQTLTPKQWTATVEKMMRWGAEMSEKDKPVVIDYLAKHFGPANRFTPVKTRPAR